MAELITAFTPIVLGAFNLFGGKQKKSSGLAASEYNQMLNNALTQQRQGLEEQMRKQQIQYNEEMKVMEQKLVEQLKQNELECISKIKSMNDEHNTELLKIQEEALINLKNQQSTFEEKSKQQSKESNIAMKTQLEQELILLNKQYKEKDTLLKTVEQQRESIAQQVFYESKLIEHFEVERTQKNVRLIIALGQTGVGKSTFCNRFIGDVSKKGDKGTKSTGFFKVGSKSIISETSLIKKKQIIKNNNKYSIVDTPGAGDSENRERQFENELVLYLRGCGGINLFLIFFDLATCRFHKHFQDFLLQCQELLGKEFWKHVIIIATKADFAEDEDIPSLKNELRERVMFDMELDEKEFEIPVISVAKNNYEKSIQDLIDIVPNKKFQCDAIKSPIDQLKIEEIKLSEKRNELVQEVGSLHAQISERNGKIDVISKMLLE